MALALSAAWAGVAGAVGGSPQTGGAKPGAAAPVELPQPLSREALRDLLARLSDAEVRELLLKQLDQEIASAARTPEPAMMTNLEATTTTLRESWRRTFASIPALPSVPVFFAEQMIGDRSPTVLIWIVLGFAAIFAAGVLAEQLFLLATREVHRQVDEARPETAAARLGYCLLRALLDLVGIVIFALATTPGGPGRSSPGSGTCLRSSTSLPSGRWPKSPPRSAWRQRATPLWPASCW